VRNLVAFVQEYKSKKSLEALNRLAPPQCHVVRDGHTRTIPAAQLVPGDIIRFARGDRIPADTRIISVLNN
jgi:Ca2+-transporting ATPase